MQILASQHNGANRHICLISDKHHESIINTLSKYHKPSSIQKLLYWRDGDKHFIFDSLLILDSGLEYNENFN